MDPADVGVITGAAAVGAIMVRSVLAAGLSGSVLVAVRNYAGRRVPTGGGVVFPLGVLPAAAAMIWRFPGGAAEVAALYLALAGGTLVGLGDDVFGRRDIKGLAGHVRTLAGGAVTWGAVKAAALVLMALMVLSVTAPGAPAGERALQTVVAAGSANLLNGCDRRPGRLLKVFLLAAAVLGAVAPPGSPSAVVVLAAGASCLAFLPWDLGEAVIAGDAGANGLGLALGVAAAVTADPVVTAGLAAAVTAFNLAFEWVSLNRIVRDTRLLRLIDDLGRQPPGPSGAASEQPTNGREPHSSRSPPP